MRLLLLFLVVTCYSTLLYAQANDSTLQINVQPITKNTVILNNNILKLISYRDSLTDTILAYAKSFLGVPYRYAGRSRAGFDCSGFVHTVFKEFGVILSTASNGMEGSGRPILNKADLQRGDILFFVNTQRRRGGVGHVAIVYEIKDGEIWFIHSACNGGVRFDVLSSAYYSAHYYKGERLKLLDIP